MQLISLEYPADNAEKCIFSREFFSVALDILGSAKALFSLD